MNASHVGDWDYSPGGGGGGDEGFAGSTTKNMKTIRYKKDDYCHKEYVFVSGFETYRNLGDTFVGIPSAFESDEVDENEYFTDPQCPDIMTQLKIKTSKSKLESLTNKRRSVYTKKRRGEEFERLLDAAYLTNAFRKRYLRDIQVKTDGYIVCQKTENVFAYAKLILETRENADNHKIPLTKESASLRWNFGLCLMPLCENRIVRRGMCLCHYRQVKDIRIEYGMLNPKRRLSLRSKSIYDEEHKDSADGIITFKTRRLLK